MQHNECRILVVEDEPDQRQLVVSMLEQEGFWVADVDGVESAILFLKKHAVDVIFSDWKLGSLSGIELLNYVRREVPDTGFIIATAYGSISHAVEAMQAGADDYLSKPFQRQELLLTIDKARKSSSLRSTNKALHQQLGEQQNLIGIIGQAPCMQHVFDRIERISNTDATVLIHGESGTGKELAARALHQLSARNQQAFIAINCGAIPESIAEAELFGAEKGAYTGANSTKIGKFEAANGGTLFLDEIAELPLNLQSKLLRSLQEGKVTRLGSHDEIDVDVRVIAASHQNLSDMVSAGDFREDLFYRLNVVPITMPPLRERQEDIPRLIEHFVEHASRRHRVTPPSLSTSTLKTLMDYHWPGNVRELSNRIERFVLLGDEQELVQGTQTPRPGDAVGHFTLPPEGINWEQFERQCLADALEQCQGNKTKAARFLQLPYKAFLYRLEKYGLS